MTEPENNGSHTWGIEEEAAPFLDDPPELAAATARGLADAEAGRTVPHAEVKAWLLRWAKGEPGPVPQSRKSLD